MRPRPTSRLARVVDVLQPAAAQPQRRRRRPRWRGRGGPAPSRRSSRGLRSRAGVSRRVRRPSMTQSRPVALRLDGHWVWDFWFARDGDDVHVFYLQAPRSLGDPELRHVNATIGHAVSRDLRDWEVLPDALGAGAPGAFDDLATWTGSVLRHDGALAHVLQRHRARRGRAGAADRQRGLRRPRDLGARGPAARGRPRAGTTASSGATRGSSGTASASTCSSARRAAAAASSATRTRATGSPGRPDRRCRRRPATSSSRSRSSSMSTAPGGSCSATSSPAPACTTCPRRTGSAPTRATRATCCPAAGRASTTPARCSSTAASAGCSPGGWRTSRAGSSASWATPMPLPALHLDRPAVPAVLERPARADRPRLHAVGGGSGRELAGRVDRVQLGRLAEPVERREHAGAHALGLLVEARRRAARPSPATSRTARSSRGGSASGSNTGLRSRRACAGRSAVSTSGSHSRSATAARRSSPARPTTAASRAASRRRAPGVAGLERHHVRAEVALDARRQRRGARPRRRERAQRRVGDRLHVGVGQRRRAARCRPARRMPPPLGAPRPARRRRASPAGRARRSASAARSGRGRRRAPARARASRRPRAAPARARRSARRRRAPPARTRNHEVESAEP